MASFVCVANACHQLRVLHKSFFHEGGVILKRLIDAPKPPLAIVPAVGMW